jgi:hypothetical protein
VKMVFPEERGSGFLLVVRNILPNYIASQSKTSLIRTNWERTLVQINESPNCRSATECKYLIKFV